MSTKVTGFKPGSKSWKKFMAKLYGWGASVVIVGALFKIQHWPFAGLLLVVGLSTEAIIFFFSAFEPLHEDPDWTLVYPELATGEAEEHEGLPEADENMGELEDQGTITEQLDKMLEEAKIGPELIESLGSGLRSLSDNATKLSDISSASVATNDYVDSLKGASSKVSELSNTYAQASEALTGISQSSGAGSQVGEYLNNIAGNLESLNNVYELQLKGSEEHLQKSNQFYEGLSELMQNLNESVEDTKKYKEEIAQLSNNLKSLNTVYGNMLTAMNPGGGAA